MTIGLICLGLVLLLAMLRVPLGISLLTVSIGGITALNSFDVARTLIPMTLSEAAFSYDLAVVPLFILMGNVLSRTGISEDLFRAANAFLGGVRGGLALATMVTCAGFSAVCGSSFATAATMAKVAYPSMQKYGYSDRLASATIAAGGTLGILIPPSIILMIYGILTQQNIGELFIAGVLPGLLGLAMYMGVIYLIAVFKPEHAPRGQAGTAQERWQSLSGVWPFVALFLLIIGGLYMGWFTPTEAGGIGAGTALLIALPQRRLGWGRFTEDAGLSRTGILMAILVVFLLLGCVMDSMAIILIFVPLFMPTLVAQGFDLVWFGIIVVVLTEIGLITPPVGMNVFVLKANLPKVPVGTIFRGLVPFMAVDILRLAVLVAFPPISLVLVQWMK